MSPISDDASAAPDELGRGAPTEGGCDDARHATVTRVQIPRRNIELKARDPDPARSLQASLDVGASDEGWLRQTDTYFRVPHGRLKLREEDAVSQLISYERASPRRGSRAR